jgi:hypothetical protein
MPAAAISSTPSSTLTRSAPAWTSRRAASTLGSGRSQLTSARSTPRLTARLRRASSSSESSPSRSRPHRLTPTLSPTETTSIPAPSRIRAVGVSQATTQASFRPSR